MAAQPAGLGLADPFPMKTGPVRRLVLLAISLLLILVPRPLAAQVYSITDLGTLGGDASEASAINESGQVVGSSMTASGATHGFLYTGRVMISLGTLPGGTSSHAVGIDDLGQVVGSSGINEYGPMFRELRQGFIWQNGTMQALGALFAPASSTSATEPARRMRSMPPARSSANRVPHRGEAVRHAFLWHGGEMLDIGGGPGSRALSRAHGINASGQVVGALEGRATLWQGGVPRDLGTLPGDAASTARAMSAAGHAVGESLAGPLQSRAVLWRSGTIQDLGSLPGDASQPGQRHQCQRSGCRMVTVC